jgi:hypothetical protein
MIFGIYARPDGAYLLVPECMTASAEAERLHGPLKFVEMMDWCEEPVPDIWKTVIGELDAHSFVVLPDAAVICLLETEGIFARSGFGPDEGS